jgi:hypothetical protein
VCVSSVILLSIWRDGRGHVKVDKLGSLQSSKTDLHLSYKRQYTVDPDYFTIIILRLNKNTLFLYNYD